MAPSRTTALRRALGVAPLHGLRSAGPCVTRVACGAVMAVHGVDKLVHGPDGFGAFLASLDVPAPSAVGWAVALGESLGGLFLVVGLLSRLTALLLSVHLCVALALVNTDTGFITPQQGAASGTGAEFPLVLIAGFLAVALSGPGPVALDRVIGIEGSSPDTRAPEDTDTGRRVVSTGPSAVRVSLVSGLIGGVIGAVMSAVANYLVVGMPSNAAANAANHAVSGLISGFLAGFLGLWTHLRKTGRRLAAASGEPGDRPDAALAAPPMSPASPVSPGSDA
ncbi:DoxX family protein [Streptomyces sp. NBC_00006]|uniref:DoxX family protein n=1 Tax=Streptomyces sp. NBC_00006 TaxID=2975619 RepID=UPI0022579E1F|nr:DoxX family protein [Streptomyces sp. NBC_00006]MCX5537620.1 DoxX family protein [Streptomyces sp. NBC_00006]